MLQHACSVSQQRGVQHQPLGPPATSCCGQQHTEGGDLGQEEGHRPCHLPCLFHSCPGLLESRSSPICEAPHRGSAQVGGLGRTVPPGLQSQLLLAPSQLAATSPDTHKAAFAFCPSSDEIVPSGPSASICCGFSRRSQQPKTYPELR